VIQLGIRMLSRHTLELPPDNLSDDQFVIANETALSAVILLAHYE
jgi:hypothetical protein